MKRLFRFASSATALLLILCTAAAPAETQPENAEQGFDEIQPLLEMSEVNDQEGMSLEEMTDAFEESAMSEYVDSSTGFSMQYPSVFLFEEEHAGYFAATADGKATLRIDNMEVQEGLNEETLKAAILFETPDAVIQKNEQNGCLRVDRSAEAGGTAQTDLYLLAERSFHHIIICYPEEEKGTFFSYIEYMINTMETNETDLG